MKSRPAQRWLEMVTFRLCARTLTFFLSVISIFVKIPSTEGYSVPVLNLPVGTLRSNGNQHVLVQPAAIAGPVKAHQHDTTDESSASALSALKLLNIDQTAWLSMHPLQRALAIGIPSALFISRAAAAATDTPSAGRPISAGLHHDAVPYGVQSRADKQFIGFPPAPPTTPVPAEPALSDLERQLQATISGAPSALAGLGFGGSMPSDQSQAPSEDPLSGAMLPLIYYLLNGISRYHDAAGPRGAGQMSEETGFRSKRSTGGNAISTPNVTGSQMGTVNVSGVGHAANTSLQAQPELLHDLQRLGLAQIRQLLPQATFDQWLQMPFHPAQAVTGTGHDPSDPRAGRAPGPTAPLEPSILDGFRRRSGHRQQPAPFPPSWRSQRSAGPDGDLVARFVPAPGLEVTSPATLPTTGAPPNVIPGTGDSQVFCTCVPTPKRTTSLPVFS